MKEKIKAYLTSQIIFSNDSEAHSLCKKSWFGNFEKDKVNYSLTEAMFLVENKKLEILSNKKILKEKELGEKLKKIDKRFQIKYSVYKDLREKGYIVKTALKFGADFRVYEKGKNPDKVHAKWIVFADYETGKLNWQEFSAKNRIANSTKKKLLLAIVDEESDVSYYEVGWIKV